MYMEEKPETQKNKKPWVWGDGSIVNSSGYSSRVDTNPRTHIVSFNDV